MVGYQGAALGPPSVSNMVNGEEERGLEERNNPTIGFTSEHVQFPSKTRIYLKRFLFQRLI